jgi:hypothetical protein
VRRLSTTKLPLFIVQLKGFRIKKKWREKLVLGKNVPFHRIKLMLPWKNSVHHNTVKKYMTKMGVKKSTPKVTARQQSIFKARLKLLTQIFFSAKSIYKCVMDDESSFTVDGNERQ